MIQRFIYLNRGSRVPSFNDDSVQALATSAIFPAKAIAIPFFGLLIHSVKHYSVERRGF